MEKLFIYRQSRHFYFHGKIYKVLFLICTSFWRVNNHVSRREKVSIGEMKVQKHNCFILLSTDDNIQFC